jgi:hypothetical protein
MEEAAKQILRFDTPDKDWPGQTRKAYRNLATLLKGLGS